MVGPHEVPCGDFVRDPRGPCSAALTRSRTWTVDTSLTTPVEPADETFTHTLLPEPPACTSTITGRHRGPLTVRDGVTCLDGATVTGPVTVAPGASLVATDARVEGPVTTTRAGAVELFGSTVSGPLTVTATTGEVQVLAR